MIAALLDLARSVAAPPPLAVLAAGTRVGRYRILEPIGQGGMGRVFLALDEELRREVALKVLVLGPPVDGELLERFRREAMAAALLEEARVVPVYDAGTTADLAWIAMKYVRGSTLHDLMADPSTDLARLGGILAEVAEAVGSAHAAGIMHRDLKPSNILVDQTGCSWLSDFGIASLPGGTQLTFTGQVVGTLAYVAPEVFEGGARAGGPASDVYSLGVVLYEALTGAPPFGFRDDDLRSVVRKVLLEPPVDPRRLDPSLPEGLCSLAMRALEKDPLRRPPDGRSFASELRRDLSDPRLRCRGRLAPHSPRRRRRRGLMAVALLVGTLCVALPAALTPRERVAAPDAAGAPPPPELEVRLEVRARFALPAGIPSPNHVTSVALSPDGARLAVAYVSGHVALLDLEGAVDRIYTLATADRAGIVEANDVAFSPDGWFLAVAATGGAVELLDLEVRSPVRILVADPAPETTTELAFHPSLPHLAAASWTEARIWNYRTGDLLHRLDHGRPGVQAIDADPEGRLLATAVHGEGYHLWTWDGEPVRAWSAAVPGHETTNLRSVRFEPAGDRIACLAERPEGGWLHLLDRTRAEPLLARELPWEGASLAWSPGGGLLAVGLANGRLLLCRASDLTVLAETQMPGGPVVALRWYRDELLAGEGDGSVSVLRVGTGGP